MSQTPERAEPSLFAIARLATLVVLECVFVVLALQRANHGELLPAGTWLAVGVFLVLVGRVTWLEKTRPGYAGSPRFQSDMRFVYPVMFVALTLGTIWFLD